MCVATLCNSNCKITNFVENFNALYEKILSSSAPLVFFKNPEREEPCPSNCCWHEHTGGFICSLNKILNAKVCDYEEKNVTLR